MSCISDQLASKFLRLIEPMTSRAIKSILLMTLLPKQSCSEYVEDNETIGVQLQSIYDEG